MSNIPDPSRRPEHDNIFNVLVPKEFDDSSFRTGERVLDSNRYDGFKVRGEDGNTYETTDLEHDEEDPDGLRGKLIIWDESGNPSEPQKVKLPKLVRESRSYKFLLVEHRKGTEIVTGALALSSIAVASLVIRRRKKHGTK